MDVQTHKAFCWIKERKRLTRIKKKNHIARGKLDCLILNAINCVFIPISKL